MCTGKPYQITGKFLRLCISSDYVREKQDVCTVLVLKRDLANKFYKHSLSENMLRSFVSLFIVTIIVLYLVVRA